ncbi:MAG: hypothetical protein LBV51_02875 [Acholeplasmatales bacterium]|jgi:hypothetical protein|nr:hypothetical protein [Acholeplasmatales bacterium]
MATTNKQNRKTQKTGTARKIVRWIGLLIFLVGLILSFVNYFTTNSATLAKSWPVVNDYIHYVTDVIKRVTENVAFLGNPIFITGMFYGGLLLLIWSLGKRVLGRIIATIMLLALVLGQMYYPSHSEVLIFTLLPSSNLGFDLPSSITSFLNTLIDTNVAKGVIAFVIYLVLIIWIWAVIALKRPKRFSTGLIRAGFAFLMLTVLVSVVLHFIPTDFYAEQMVYVYSVYFYVSCLFYVLSSLGSIFGLIFCWVK